MHYAQSPQQPRHNGKASTSLPRTLGPTLPRSHPGGHGRPDRETDVRPVSEQSSACGRCGVGEAHSPGYGAPGRAGLRPLCCAVSFSPRILEFYTSCFSRDSGQVSARTGDVRGSVDAGDAPGGAQPPGRHPGTGGGGDGSQSDALFPGRGPCPGAFRFPDDHSAGSDPRAAVTSPRSREAGDEGADLQGAGG